MDAISDDYLFLRNYGEDCWQVVRQISYNDDDYVEIKRFDTMEECRLFIESLKAGR